MKTKNKGKKTTKQQQQQQKQTTTTTKQKQQINKQTKSWNTDMKYYRSDLETGVLSERVVIIQ